MITQNGYSLDNAVQFARKVKKDPALTFNPDTGRALKQLALANRTRLFKKVIDSAVEQSPDPEILAKLEWRCIGADQGYIALGRRAWNAAASRTPLSIGETQAYFQKFYGEHYYKRT